MDCMLKVVEEEVDGSGAEQLQQQHQDIIKPHAMILDCNESNKKCGCLKLQINCKLW